MRRNTLKRSPMKRPRAPMARRTRIRPRNEARRLRDWPRQFHSAERVRWVKGLPCSTCENRGHLPVENSHIVGRRVGTYADIIPQCTTCHREIHAGIKTFLAARGLTRDDLRRIARETDANWKALQIEPREKQPGAT